MPTVPSQRTWADGDALNTTNLNASISDPLEFLLNRPTAMLRQSSAQSVANASWTAITLGVEDVDSDMDGVGGHSTSSNTSRYTARYAGWHRLGGGTMWAANVTGLRGAAWAVNGTLVSGCESLFGAASVGSTGVPARSILVYLGVGDYVELYGYQGSGGALNTAVTGSQQPSVAITWESN